MDKEEAMRFVEERLRHHASPVAADLRLWRPPRVTRRFVVEMHKGEHRTFERVDASVHVFCTTGSLWITHDGDPKDVILYGGERYRAQREDAMHVFALQDCQLEIEFQDEASTQH
ncbi:MAG: DUF2917 domain-containing protein [Comamonadaceae bacterium]|nr:MAG: DUF2917 domain-containing protein [Comamonadaceae bacterium]